MRGSDRTKEIDICAMSRDNRKDHRYFVSVASHDHKSLLRVHLDEWLFKSFPNVQVQSTTFYPTRVDSVNANAVLDATTRRVSPQVASSISEENGNLAGGRVGSLSQPGKKYGSMVLYLNDKSQVDSIIARGLLEVGGESGTTQTWEERGKTEQKCLNCQKQGHLARVCKEATVCGNCAGVGHHHREYLTSTPKCTHRGGNHRAKDHKSSSSVTVLTSLINLPQVTQSLKNTNSSVLLPGGGPLTGFNKVLIQPKINERFSANEARNPSEMNGEW